MSKKDISLAEFGRIINRLMTESIPVMGFFVDKSGANTRLFGFVDSATSKLGIVISASQGTPSASSVLNVPMGNPVGTGCTFVLADSGEIPESKREDLELKFGNRALSVFLDSGGVLTIFFTSGPEV